MPRFAIVYETRYGQTRKIVERLALELQTQRAAVDLFGDPHAYPESVSEYDTVILGGPVYVGQLPVELLKWALVHSGELGAKDVALFSVSLNAADSRPSARAADREILDGFCTKVGLQPRVRASLKGALPYTKYNWFHRMMLLRISRSVGGPIDVKKDHEMTDWDEVAAFARSCFERSGRSLSATSVV